MDKDRCQELFGHRLRFLRKLEDRTQAQLAEAADISLEHLNKLERGVAAPSFDVIRRLAEALATEPANLFLFSEYEDDADSFQGRPETDIDHSIEWSKYVTRIGYWELDLQTREMQWSDGMYRLFGYEPGEIEPSKEFVNSRIFPPDLERVEAAQADLLRGRPLHKFEFRFYRKDNTLRAAIIDTEVEHNGEAEPVRIVAAVMDVTEQKRLGHYLRENHQTMERRVKERTERLNKMVMKLGEEIQHRKKIERDLSRSEDKFRNLVQSIPHGLGEVDLKGRITFVNDAYCRIFGMELRELANVPVWKALATKESAAQVKAFFDAAVHEQFTPKPYFLKTRRKDGTEIEVRFDWDYRRDEKGKLLGFSAIVTDITEERRAQEQQRLYEAVVSSSKDIMAFVGKDLRYKAVNAAYENYSGRSREEIVGTAVSQFMHEEFLGKNAFEKTIKPQLERCLQGEHIRFQEWFSSSQRGSIYTACCPTPFFQSRFLGFTPYGR